MERLKGQVIKVSQNSTQYINPMDINLNYSEGDTPIALKSDFILSFCELMSIEWNTRKDMWRLLKKAAMRIWSQKEIL